MITVHARPGPVSFDMAHTAVLAIDFQRDFFEPGGFGAALGNPVKILASCIPSAVALFAWARSQGLTMIHTREGHVPDLSDCPARKRQGFAPGTAIGEVGPMGRRLVRGEPGHDFIDACAPLPGEWIIDKPGKGAFYATDLEHRLRQAGITQLIICGVTTEVCVQTTAREAADRGFGVLLVADATASYFPSFKTAALDMMAAQGGIVGQVTEVAALVHGAALSLTNQGNAQRFANLSNHAANMIFDPLRPGVDIAWLVPPGAVPGLTSALLRYAPGASVPLHEHQGTEHIYILEGSQQDEAGEYHAGACVINPAASRHRVSSPHGCLALLVWERPVRFLATEAE